MGKPKINPPLGTIDVLIEALAAICLVYMVAQFLIEYPGIEKSVPINFDGDGTPEAWGDKTSLLIIPAVSIFLYAGLTILNRSPHIFNYPVPITEENASKQYQLAKSLISTLKFTTTGLFLYIQLQTINVAKEVQDGLETSFLVLIVVGSFLPILIYFILASKNK